MLAAVPHPKPRPMLDVFDPPYMQRGLLEVALLSVAAGLARHLDRAARPGVLRPRRGHGRLPRPRAGRWARVRRRRSAPSPPRRSFAGGVASWLGAPATPRRLRQRHGAGARRLPRAGRHSGERRVPLGSGRRGPAVRQRPADRQRRPRAGRGGQRARARGDVVARPPLARRGLRPAAARRSASARGLARRGAARARSDWRRRRAVHRRRAARDRAVRGPRGDACAWSSTGCAPGRRRRWCSCSSRASAGLWLSVETNAPPGATIAVLAGGVFALAALVRAPAARRLRPPRSAAAALVGALAAGRLRSARRPRPRAEGQDRCRRHHDAARRFRARGRRRSRRGAPDPPAQHRSARLRAAAQRRAAPRPTPKVVFENGDSLDQWMRKVVSESGGEADRGRRRRGRPGEGAGRVLGPEASRYDPHWWHDPRQRARGGARDPRRPEPGRSGGARPRSVATRAPTTPSCARSTAGSARCFAAVPPAAAQARDRPRRLQLLRQALRHPGDRRRHPLADDAGPALGRRRRAS